MEVQLHFSFMFPIYCWNQLLDHLISLSLWGSIQSHLAASHQVRLFCLHSFFFVITNLSFLSGFTFYSNTSLFFLLSKLIKILRVQYNHIIFYFSPFLNTHWILWSASDNDRMLILKLILFLWIILCKSTESIIFSICPSNLKRNHLHLKSNICWIKLMFFFFS